MKTGNCSIAKLSCRSPPPLSDPSTHKPAWLISSCRPPPPGDTPPNTGLRSKRLLPSLLLRRCPGFLPPPFVPGPWQGVERIGLVDACVWIEVTSDARGEKQWWASSSRRSDRRVCAIYFDPYMVVMDALLAGAKGEKVICPPQSSYATGSATTSLFLLHHTWIQGCAQREPEDRDPRRASKKDRRALYRPTSIEAPNKSQQRTTRRPSGIGRGVCPRHPVHTTRALRCCGASTSLLALEGQ